MKNAVTLTLLCVLTISAAARAADGPKLVGEKEIMALRSKNIAYSENDGVSSMKLSPDGRKMLYFRKKAYTTSIDGKKQMREGYKTVLRDLKTGKDTPLPIPAIPHEEFASTWLSMTVFDPAGKTIIVPAGQDGDKNGLAEKNEKCKTALYDIASGKLTTLEIGGNFTLPAFHPNGKTLVVMVITGREGPAEIDVCVSPTDKIKFRSLTQTGVPRSICPTSNLMAMLLIPIGEPRPGDCVLYDLTTDTVKSKLCGQDQADAFTKNNMQWTADGRYLYHVMTKNENRDVRRHTETLTRVWDVQAGKEVGVFSGVVPIGPGPGKASMVLWRRQTASEPKDRPQVLLHTPDGKLKPFGDKSIHPISTQGKWLLYIRTDADGKEKACMAEIVLPKK